MAKATYAKKEKEEAKTTVAAIAVDSKPKPYVTVCMPDPKASGLDVELGHVKAGSHVSLAIDGTLERYSESKDGGVDLSIEPSAVKGGMVEEIKALKKSRIMK